MALVESVRSAIAIVRFLVSQPKPYGINAIARELGISPSSCFNLVKTLAAEGLLAFDERDKTYSPGPSLATLAARTRGDEQIFASAEVDLQALAKRYACTTSLWRLSGDRVVLIDAVSGGAMMNIHLNRGLRLPALLGAMGRCIAGHQNLDRTELDSELRKIQWSKPPSLASFVRDAKRAKLDGWALDIDHYMLGITTVASPIIDAAGSIRFCIANIELTGAKSPAQLNDLGAASARTAHVLGKRLFPT